MWQRKSRNGWNRGGLHTSLRRHELGSWPRRAQPAPALGETGTTEAVSAELGQTWAHLLSLRCVFLAKTCPHPRDTGSTEGLQGGGLLHTDETNSCFPASTNPRVLEMGKLSSRASQVLPVALCFAKPLVQKEDLQQMLLSVQPGPGQCRAMFQALPETSLASEILAMLSEVI